MDQVLQLFEQRYSARKYKPDGVVSDAQVEALLHAAMLSPSAVNARPWHFVVVRDRALLDAIRAKHPFARMLSTAQLAIVVVAKPAQEGAVAHPFFPQDCGAATMSILLQATAMGLGACWCGVYPREEVMGPIREILELPAKSLPFSLIAVGVPEGEGSSRGFYDPDAVTWK